MAFFPNPTPMRWRFPHSNKSLCFDSNYLLTSSPQPTKRTEEIMETDDFNDEHTNETNSWLRYPRMPTERVGHKGMADLRGSEPETVMSA